MFLAVEVKVAESCPTLCNPMDSSPSGSSVHGGFSRHEYWGGWPCPPPGNLLNTGVKLGLPHCRQILHHLSHQGFTCGNSVYFPVHLHILYFKIKGLNNIFLKPD